MEWFTSMLAKYPELAVYLAMGIGYWIGSVKIRGFSLGGVTGSLVAGITLGLLFNVPVSGAVKSTVFLLFLFGIGYEVGPKFFRAMKGDGWRFAVIGIIVPITGLLTAWGVASFLKLDLGFAAGLLSGALTESPAMGTASEAINAMSSLTADVKETYIAHIGVADALCYVFGALGVIMFCSTIGPKLLGIDMREEALKLEAHYGIKRTKMGVSSAWQPFEFRAYRIQEDGRAVGLTVAEAEKMQPGMRVFIERIRRGDDIVDVQPDVRLMAGDIVVVSGRRESLVEVLGAASAKEVEDRELLDIPVASFDIFVAAKGAEGRTLLDLAGDEAVRGVFLRRIIRYGQDIPIGTGTVVERGDVLQVVGTEAAVARAVQSLGVVVEPRDTTDFVAVGLAIFIGAILGAAAAFTIGGVNVSIGTSVGALIAGIVTGYIRSKRPLFGRVPDGAVKFMQSYGLAGFVAMVGIGAGPHFIAGVREAGVGLLLGGVVVTLVPMFVGLYFGRYVLGLNPLLLLGALSGAQTFTPGLAVVQEKSGSTIAVLGYSAAVPLGHVLLTMFGTAIVLLMSR